ncbi:MAG: Yip1 family protein [Candidatus Eisenbacteria bacterium]
MTTDASSTETRPLNPLAALTLILVFPGRTFRRLTERPHWILPLAFVISAAVLSGLLAFSAGFMDEEVELRALLTGNDPVEIRSGTPAAMVISGIVGVTGATLLQTLLFMVVARLLGGRGTFRRAFSAVCHASVPIGVSAILLTALIPFTHTAMSGLNLTFTVDKASSPFLWGVASQSDLAVIWFLVLLGISGESVFGLPRRRARMAAAIFGVISVLGLGWMGRGEAIRSVNPFSDWSWRESQSVVLRYESDVFEETLEEILEACARTRERVKELTDADPGGQKDTGFDKRIDCYLYASLEEKLRVTDNPAIAHRVEWAGAVHVAWVGGSEAALTREMFKLVSARAQGRLYTPLIRDGLAVYAGRTWGGRPVREEGADLLGRKVLPDLDMLVDAAMFVRLDERLSQPAAGSLMDFLFHEKGIEALRDLYADSAGRSDVAGALIESAFGDSLDAVEERWLEYLESATDTLGANSSDAE